MCFGFWVYCMTVYSVASILLVSAQDDECPSASNPSILSAEIGISKPFVTSGFYRGVYPPNLDCHWIIRSPGPEAWLQLIIHYSHVEDRLFTDCDDYIELRDGPTSQSPLVLQWCGIFNPSAFSSTNEAFYLRFKSDPYFEEGRGLNMSYIAYSRPGCPPGWKESPSTHTCYHLVSPQPPFPKLPWVEAQKRCSYERANLLVITSDEERTQVLEGYGSSSEQPWIGVNDAQEEGTYTPIDPNAKLYPDPFIAPKSGASQHCVYMDLMHGGDAMYNAADCRMERSYLCERRIDGTTVPYPPPEAIIRSSLISAASVAWNPAYLWLLIIVILLLLLLACVPCLHKRYKEYKSNRIAQTEPDPRNVLLSNNAVALASNNGADGVQTGAVGSGGVIYTYDNGPKRSVESTAVQTVPATADTTTNERRGTVSYRVASAGTTRVLPTGQQGQPRRHSGTIKHVLPLAPVEKFDRPIIRTLDNVSAISLDEFWHKIESERIRKIDVRQTPPIEHV